MKYEKDRAIFRGFESSIFLQPFISSDLPASVIFSTLPRSLWTSQTSHNPTVTRKTQLAVGKTGARLNAVHKTRWKLPCLQWKQFSYWQVYVSFVNFCKIYVRFL